MGEAPARRLANVLAAAVFGYLAAGPGRGARSIALLEFRLGVYRFPLWPFKTLFALAWRS